MVINVENCNPEAGAQMIIGPTIIDDTRSSALQNEIDFLELFRTDNRTLFVSTEFFVQSAALLDEHHLLVVTGAPGMGKTFNSQQLLLQVCVKKQCKPFQPSVPEQYSQWCNTRERQGFLMDDVFGQSSFNQASYDAWMIAFPKIVQHLKLLNAYFIFTCRENILKSHLTVLKATGLFNNVINLSDEKFQLTTINKAEMFWNHTHKFNIDIKYRELEDTQSQGRDPMGFPQRIHLFCSMINVSNETRMRYFNRPMEFLSTLIGSYRENDHVAYCVLILLLLHDGQLQVSFLNYSNKSKLLQRCLDMCDIPTSTMGALREKADSLCGSFLLLANDRYVYHHQSVMEAVTLDFGQRHPSDILNSCSFHFLLERVFTRKSAPSDNEYVVILQPIMFPLLCARLVIDLKDNMRLLSSYAVFKDDEFNQEFLCHLQDTGSLHLLLASLSSDNTHTTFLFLAAASGQVALVRAVLFSRDVQRLPGFRDHLDRVLYAACYSGSPATVRALLSVGARADCRTAYDPFEVKYGRWMVTTTSTTLIHAAYSGCTEVLQLAIDRLQQQRVNVVEVLSIRDNGGMTALHWWVEGGRGEDALQILLEAGADVHAKDGEGKTALHRATVWWGGSAIVQLLVDAGADVNAMDDEGQTSLHCVAAAARWGNADIVRLLVKAGADVHAKDNRGRTALHHAAAVECGGFPSVDALLEAGADVHAKDDGDWTALHHAVDEWGDADIVRLLVKAGADVPLG